MNNFKKKSQNKSSLNLVLLSLFGGIIAIMAFVPFVGYIPLGFTRATIIHVPVIIGAIVLGPKNGAILGFLFGFTSLINNTINPTATSFVFSPFYSVGEMSGGIGSLIICFIPRILVGIVPYYVFKWITNLKTKDNKPKVALGLTLAGISGAMTNTLLVMNLIFLMFRDTYAGVNGISPDVLYSFIAGIIGINGIPEAIVAGILVLGIGKSLLKNQVTKQL